MLRKSTSQYIIELPGLNQAWQALCRMLTLPESQDARDLQCHIAAKLGRYVNTYLVLQLTPSSPSDFCFGLSILVHDTTHGTTTMV